MSKKNLSTNAFILFELPRAINGLSIRRKYQLLALQVLCLVSAGAEVINLSLLYPFLQLVSNPTKSSSALSIVKIQLKSLSHIQIATTLGISFLIIIIASTILRSFAIFYQLKLSALLSADLGSHIFSSVLNRSLSWHLNHNSSYVIRCLTKDVDQAYSCIQAGLSLVVNIFIVAFLGTYLLLSFPLPIIALGSSLMVFYLGIYQYSKVNLLEAGHEHVVNYETSVKTAQEALGSIRDILIDKKQLYFQGLYSQYNKKYRIASASINTLAQIPRYLVEGFLIIAICGLVMILTYFGYSVTTLLPTIGVILLGSYRLLQPLQQCFSSFSIFRAARPSIENINSIIWNGSLSTNIGFVSTINPHRQNYKSTATKAMPIIRFSDVSFSYRTSEDVWALVDVSLSINPGDKVAIVGLSGSGKSTCCDLILGLLQPTKGHIYVEGRDLNLSHNEPATWQRRIAYVPQDIYLLDGSFIANIAFGSNEDSIDYARVRMAAEKARILELILSTPGGFDTPVGERGVRLSGGQRQRIGIARALYKEASVLVFDEATSSLDTLTESQISQSISDLDSSITTILIAHRMTTILRSNVIFLLSKGKLIASGTYDELRNNFPEFRKLTG